MHSTNVLGTVLVVEDPKWGRVLLQVTFTKASYNAQGGNIYRELVIVT